jgi:hypothetical protein
MRVKSGNNKIAAVGEGAARFREEVQAATSGQERDDEDVGEI